jgi:hypothetical protein
VYPKEHTTDHHGFPMDWTIMTLFELEMNLLQGPLGHLVPGNQQFFVAIKSKL